MNQYEIQRGFIIVLAVFLISGIAAAPGVFFYEKFAFYLTNCNVPEQCWLENGIIGGIASMAGAWIIIIPVWSIASRIKRNKIRQEPKPQPRTKKQQAIKEKPKPKPKSDGNFSFNR